MWNDFVLPTASIFVDGRDASQKKTSWLGGKDEHMIKSFKVKTSRKTIGGFYTNNLKTFLANCIGCRLPTCI